MPEEEEVEEEMQDETEQQYTELQGSSEEEMVDEGTM